MTSASIFKFISLAAGLLACGYALWRGGRVERWAAGLILADWLASPFLKNADAFRHAQYAIFYMDGVLTLALIAIATMTNRYWALWVAAFQLLELLMHIAMLIDPSVRPRAYYVGMEIWSYLMLLALVIGAWRETPHGRKKTASLSAATPTL